MKRPPIGGRRAQRRARRGSPSSQAEHDLRRSRVHQRLIAEVAEAVAVATEEQALLATATQLVRGVVRAENCGFLLIDEAAGVLRHAPSFQTRSAAPLLPLPLTRGIAGAVARSGVARRVDDVSLDPDYVEIDPLTRSELCVPLRAGEHVLGVFDAERRRLAAFSAAELELVKVVTSHVAGAVERLRANAALREGGELYRAYFTASPLALFVANAAGRYLEVNGAACALTGYTPAQLCELSLGELIAGGDVPGLAERLLGLIALGSGGNEIRIRRRDGSLRSCLMHATTVGPDRVLGLLLDITDRKEAEEKLRDSEERFRGLSEAAFEAILVHEGGRIVDVNHALCELTGYSWHELVDRSCFELVAPETREAAHRTMLAELAVPSQVEIVRRDGRRLPAEVQSRAFPYRGRVLRVVAVRDVSERQRALELRESLIRALEAKNAELERFGYAVTHDLKAPLVTIRGFADYLARDARDGRSDRLAGDAARIADAASSMQRLLDRLFELSRASRPVGPPVAAPAAELVQEALRLLRDRCLESGSTVELAPELPVLHGDRSRLVQVFQNLLDNALKFGAGRAVRVLAREPRDGRAVLVVQDEGIGIEARHRYRVLDVFTRLDPRGEGVGIGLAVVKRIVESHGGRVWLESDGPQRGSSACVELPLAAEREKRATEAAERQPVSAIPAAARRGI